MGNVIAGKPFRMGALFAFVAAMALALTVGSALAAGALVDVNTADQKTLESLPGVGPATAKEIVKGRPYKSVDDLANVKGLGKAKLEKIKPLVTVGGQSAAQAPPAAGAAAGAAASKATATTQAAQKAPAEAKKPAKTAVPTGPVNLNSASKEQLVALPGIGEKKRRPSSTGGRTRRPRTS